MQSPGLLWLCAALLINGHTFNHSATANPAANGSVSDFDVPEKEANSFRMWAGELKQLICAEIFDEFPAENDNLFRTETETEVLPGRASAFCQPAKDTNSFEFRA